MGDPQVKASDAKSDSARSDAKAQNVEALEKDRLEQQTGGDYDKPDTRNAEHASTIGYGADQEQAGGMGK